MTDALRPAGDARAYLFSVVAAPRRSALEAMDAGEEAPPPAPGDLMPAKIPADVDPAMVERTVEKLVEKSPLTAQEAWALEAIIIPDKRPAIDVVGGDFTIDHPSWTHWMANGSHTVIRDALPSVGRIELPGNPAYPFGGTGFVVGAGLIMTNRHVAAIFAEGLGVKGVRFQTGARAGVDFLQERDGGSDYIEVRSIVMVHPYWDMAILKVEGLDPRHRPLQLAKGDPNLAFDREVAVIGYPAFDPRNAVDVQTRLFGGRYNIKRLQPGRFGRRATVTSFGKPVSAATHDSSTLGGNSGSAILDPADGRVLGLHFGGQYLVSNYGVPAGELAKDQRVIDAGVIFADTPRAEPGPWDEFWRGVEMAETSSALPAVIAPSGLAPAPVAAAAPGAVLRDTRQSGAVRFTVPIEITVSLGETGAPLVAAADAAGALERAVEPLHEPIERPRAGYDVDFLGVPVPWPDVVDESVVARLEDGGYRIPYHHFSVVMHKRRRLALFTAANVDARPERKQPEPGRSYTRKGLTGLGENDRERWFMDLRLRGVDQLPDRFFEKDGGAFDKGHLVRREDVAYGDSFGEVQAANGDTYHTTNCSPQVANFNRSDHRLNWGALEDLVLRSARSELYCLFSGPVLAEADPIFVGVDDVGSARLQIPREYWKLVVAREGAGLRAYAFILKQNLEATPLEFVVPEAWRPRMISIADLETKLRVVRFPPVVRAADRYAAVQDGNTG
jgi:DNA/RNA endonuclease G (NUC1)